MAGGGESLPQTPGRRKPSDARHQPQGAAGSSAAHSEPQAGARPRRSALPGLPHASPGPGPGPAPSGAGRPRACPARSGGRGGAVSGARPPVRRAPVRALSPPPPAEPRPGDSGRAAGDGAAAAGDRDRERDSGSHVLAAHSPMPGSSRRAATTLSCRGTACTSSLGVFLKQPSHREHFW